MKKKMQQGGRYWNGTKWVQNKIPWQNGMQFANGGMPPARTDIAIPYTANGMTQWQGQGINFRSPDPNYYSHPQPSFLPGIAPVPASPMDYGYYSGYGQGTGQGVLPSKVGIGGEGDVFGSETHSPFMKKGGKVKDMKEWFAQQQVNNPAGWANSMNLQDAPESLYQHEYYNGNIPYYNPVFMQRAMGDSMNNKVNWNLYDKYLPLPYNHGVDYGTQGSGVEIPNYNSEGYKKGGIYIKPSKRGTFTAAAKKHGQSVQGFASQVLAHPGSYSPAMRKKAQFAHNSAQWHHQYGGPVMQYGGFPDNDGDIDQMKDGGHWIQKATAHMRKDHPCTGSKFGSSTCPPGSKRYNLAKVFKSMHHQYGGPAMPQYDGGGNYPNPWQTVNPNDAIMEQMYAQRDHTANVIQENPDIYSGKPMVTGNQPEGMTPMDNNITPGQYSYPQQQSMAYGRQHPYGNGFKNLLGAGMIAGAYFADRKSQRDAQMQNMNNGMTSMYGMNPLGSRGDYNQQGIFRPTDRIPTAPGKFYPGMKMGGSVPCYDCGGPMKKYDGGGINLQNQNTLQVNPDIYSSPQEPVYPITQQWNNEAYSGMNFNMPLKKDIELQANYDPRYRGDTNWLVGAGIPVQNIQKGIKSLFTKRKYKAGGTYSVNDNELQHLLSQGYEVEFL